MSKRNLCFPSSSDESDDDNNNKRQKSSIFDNKQIIASENLLNSIKTENKISDSSNSDEDETKESVKIINKKKLINYSSSDLSPQISLLNKSSSSSTITGSTVRNSKLTLGDLRKKDEDQSIFLQKSNNNIKNEKSIPKQQIISKTVKSISDDDKKDSNDMIDDDDDEWMDNHQIINLSEEQTKPKTSSKSNKESVSDNKINSRSTGFSSSNIMLNNNSNNNNSSKKKRENNQNSTNIVEKSDDQDDEVGVDWLDCHPNSFKINRDEEPLILESDNEEIPDCHVNQYANRFLMDHQVIGVKWLWSKYCASTGCILGDDMGMGKTVQVAALFLALYGKNGTNQDKINLKNHRNLSANDKLGKFRPSLVLCPSSVVTNWFIELNNWGHFSIAIMNNGANDSIEKIERNEVEILIGSYDMLTRNVNRLSKIFWNVTVFDEGHIMKNIKTNKYLAAMSLRKKRSCIMLTGTPIQNNSKELWSLLSLIDHNFMSKKDFDSHFATPIERSMNNNAARECIELGNQRKKELQKKLKSYHIARKKESLTGTNALKGKDDVIVMCDLSPLQKILMKEVLLLPDVILVKHKRTHEIPTIINSNGYTIINPKAVIWKQNHINDEECDRCPSCIQFPIITKLLHICSHPSLLQINQSKIDKEVRNEQLKDFIENSLCPATQSMLGGPYKDNNILSHNNTETSGKMKTLQMMLDYFTGISEKTLVFSYSTMMLDILEDFIKSRGWNFLRLDGNTNTNIRQSLVNKFNNNKSYEIFLISSKAGGLGLNLKSATKVIIFDMSWNPSVDMQAQDRAYRIGQGEHVSVYRLVAKGTIEEVVYMKQLYKQELQKLFMEGTSGPRNFESDDLKGIARLLQYSEASIFQTLRDKYANEENDNKINNNNSTSNNDNNNQLTDAEIKLQNNRDNRNKLNGICLNNKTIMREIEDAITNNIDEIEDPDELIDNNEFTSKSDSNSFNILGLLGINPNNTHRNDDMLKDKDNDKDDNDDENENDNEENEYVGTNKSKITNFNNDNDNNYTKSNKSDGIIVIRKSTSSSYDNNSNPLHDLPKKLGNKDKFSQSKISLSSTITMNKNINVDKKESILNNVNNNMIRNVKVNSTPPLSTGLYQPSYMKKKKIEENQEKVKN